MIRISPLIAIFATIGIVGNAAGQGLYVDSSGPIGRSFAGATTAAPLDAASALYWNPATMTGLDHSEVMFGGELLYANTYLASSIPGQYGIDRSDSGVSVLSGFAFVRRIEGSRLSYGLAIPTIAGGGVNFPGDPSNPALAPTGPLGNVILGPNASSALIMQLAPSAAYQVTESLSVAFGPTADVALVSFDPAFFAAPNDANGDGRFTYPSATHSRPFWGGGFKTGLYYHVTPTVDAGFSYASPQWFEKWKFNARNEIGQPETLKLQATLPSIYSWGFAYKGIERALLSVDFRLFDYKNTDLFGTSITHGGLGWGYVFASAFGGQYQLTDRATLRAGYLYNQNPLPQVGTFFNAQLPAVVQHTLSFGGTYDLTDFMSLSLAYVHGFEGSRTGSVLQAAGVNVGVSSAYDSIIFGMNFKFGGPVHPQTSSVVAPVASPATSSPDIIETPALSLPSTSSSKSRSDLAPTKG